MKQYLLLLITSILVIGFSACDNSKDYEGGGLKWKFEGTYSGDQLDITLDGKTLQNVKAEISVITPKVYIKLTGFQGNSSAVTWTSPFDEEADSYIYSGTYTAPDGTTIQFETTFGNLLLPKKTCKIVCETIN